MVPPTFLVSPALTAARWASQSVRRVRVLVHRAYVTDGPPGEQFFMKATNLSRSREVTITYTWVEGSDAEIDFLNENRPLPARLRVDEPYETWLPVASIDKPDGAEWRFRVQLSSGKVIKSRPNAKVRPFGYIAGGGESPYVVGLPTESPIGPSAVNPAEFKHWHATNASGPSAAFEPNDDIELEE